MYKKDDYIMLKNPEYPELEGLCQLVSDQDGNLVYFVFCGENSKWTGHVNHIRPATENEINDFFTT